MLCSNVFFSESSFASYFESLTKLLIYKLALYPKFIILLFHFPSTWMTDRSVLGEFCFSGSPGNV